MKRQEVFSRCAEESTLQRVELVPRALSSETAEHFKLLDAVNLESILGCNMVDTHHPILTYEVLRHAHSA